MGVSWIWTDNCSKWSALSTGLSFFALLLTQINNLNDVLGKEVQESNDIKNS